jgi:hypothetical protein
LAASRIITPVSLAKSDGFLQKTGGSLIFAIGGSEPHTNEDTSSKTIPDAKINSYLI